MSSSRTILSLFLTLLISVGLVGCSDEMPTSKEDTSPAESINKQAANHGGQAQVVDNFVAELSGGEIVPLVDTDARGLAKFQLNKAGDELSFKLNVANIDNVIGAHIHNAPAGENGSIVVFLFGNPFTDAVTVNGTLDEGTITASDVLSPMAGDFDALVEAMRNGNTYVQVHTTEHPPGEIRGQIDHGNATRSGSEIHE